jgi:hypothetical protein
VDGTPVTTDAELKCALALIKQRDQNKRFELTIVEPDISSKAPGMPTPADTSESKPPPERKGGFYSDQGFFSGRPKGQAPPPKGLKPPPPKGSKPPPPKSLKSPPAAAAPARPAAAAAEAEAKAAAEAELKAFFEKGDESLGGALKDAEVKITTGRLKKQRNDAATLVQTKVSGWGVYC